MEDRSQKSEVRSQSEWIRIAFVEGQGTTTEIADYIFKDKISEPGKYSYRLKQIDFDGSFSYSRVVEVSVNIPTEFVLYQNYPNPFNPSTTIKFTLPSEGNIKLSIYNSIGQLVETIVDKQIEAGYHEVEFNASNYTSGIYFYRLESEKFNAVRKMILLQ